MKFFKMIFQDPTFAKSCCVAIMGGGGKTTLLHRLGNELSNNFNVLLTSLTKSAFNPENKVVFVDSIQDSDLSPYFKNYNPLCIMQSRITAKKFSGISESKLYNFYRQADLCLFECDGARNLPLKVHQDSDPVVPSFSTHLIILVGADVVNTTLKEGKIHRPDLFQTVWNIQDDYHLDAEFIAEVVTSRKGYLSKISNNINLTYFVNKADLFLTEARDLAGAIYRKSHCPTFFGSLQKNLLERIR